MSSSGPGWESLLSTDAPAGSQLRAALLTTYDRPDERLLAEHLLPLLLKTSREPDGEGRERQFFLVELDRLLKHLHDKIVVVSSAVRSEEPDDEHTEDEAYGWIWRSIRHLTVGSQGKAVQHAKLWLLHWVPSDEEELEHLEIVVSSANLTLSAFKGQLQGAWRACIPLEARRSEARLGGWGVLPAFIRELARSSNAGERLAPFLELLARAECPTGASFVASVPGTHSKKELQRTPWGIAGLASIAPPGKGKVTTSVMAPYVGVWNPTRLRAWCGRIGGVADRLQLVWIDEDHPWARAKRWLLPKPSLKALRKTGATILQLRHAVDDPDATDSFHEEHQPADDRWSHAKVYVLRRGGSRRLLLTSANFSTAAWGSEGSGGDLTIENFELGVCLDQKVWPLFESLYEFEDGASLATVPAPGERKGSAISWAQASWDGKKVALACRCEAKRQLKGRVSIGKHDAPVGVWRVAPDGRLRTAAVAWTKSSPPSLAWFTSGEETVRVPVFDERSPKERESALPPEVDEDAAQDMLDQLLFEQYGGVIASEDEGEEGDASVEGGDSDGSDSDSDGEGGTDEGDNRTDDEKDVVDAGCTDSYAVPAFVLARRHLEVVDSWAQRVGAAASSGNGDIEREWLERDGQLLVDAFERQAARDGKSTSANALGAKLAAEELAVRLKHLRKAG